jgi:hypothetical protein
MLMLGVLPVLVVLLVCSPIRLQPVAGMGSVAAILFYGMKYFLKQKADDKTKTRLPVMFHATPLRTTLETDIEVQGFTATTVAVNILM